MFWEQGAPLRASVGKQIAPPPESAADASNDTPSELSAGSSPVLTNSAQSIRELITNDRAILLANAWWDTSMPGTRHIPQRLRSGMDPGAYIVQSRSGVSAAFRKALKDEGATVVSYIPNNALLVKADASTAGRIASRMETAAVLPFDAYYKLSRELLPIALHSGPGSGNLTLDVLLLSGSDGAFDDAATGAGFTAAREEASPIGVIVSGSCPMDRLAELARLPQVQAIQLTRQRVPASDNSRAFAGISCSSTSPENYLGLTGSNVVVALADTGVDGNHPDLSGRLLFDSPEAAVDSVGHGTHVAGVIAGSGASSLLATNVPGSAMPPASLQFRGMAPLARLYCSALTGTNPPSDVQLQTAAATVGAPIANHSWVYESSFDYDFAAASYDSAVRDALPIVPGPQPLLFVFPAGNSGQGMNNGTGGNAGSIASPGTAKNVLTVGALEQPRWITNTVVVCTNDICVTNQPWLSETDSTNQAAGFSGRGNVGVGMEGAFGRLKPDMLAPGTFVVSARSSQWDADAYYGASGSGVVLSNLNGQLGPHYRFESGTSIASGCAAGALALIQEFWVSRLSEAPTPALLKALIIHGAEPNAGTGLAITSQTNLSGWGAVNLRSSLRGDLTNQMATTNSMFIEQDQWLATGEAVTYRIRVLDHAFPGPLLATLAWTDPPGNPVAGLKLVNDLDLVVTNLDTGDVYFGNAFESAAPWSLAWNGASTPNQDRVNNLEKARISGPLATNYTITVRAHRVNVDCGSESIDRAAQDFALAISCGEPSQADTMQILGADAETNGPPQPTLLTNSFIEPGQFGSILTAQRFGSHAPGSDGTLVSLPGSIPSAIALGETNQWRFYVITNEPGFPNAAFVLFDAKSLSADPATGPPALADVDLYVSQDPALLDLNPATLAAAMRSIAPGTDELILSSAAAPGPYYIAIKCESYRGAEASLAVFFAQEPFSSSLEDGRKQMRGLPTHNVISNATNAAPEDGIVFFFPPPDIMIRRVVVSNVVTHPAPGDVQTWLYHDRSSVLLRDFSSATGAVSASFTYDDSLELDLPGAIPSAVPGSMTRWNGTIVSGPWILRHISRGATGTNEEAALIFYPDFPEAAELATLQPWAERWEYFHIPPACTNLSGQIAIISGGGPLWVELSPVWDTRTGFNQVAITGAWNSAVLIVDGYSDPPVQPGIWRARLRNAGGTPVMCQADWTLSNDPDADPWIRFRIGSSNAIRDDALTICEIPVTSTGSVLSVEAGIRVEHPRLGDLEFTLVSPDGTRAVLQSHRGCRSTNGLGLEVMTTNLYPVSSSGGPHVASNIFNLKRKSGTIALYYNFYGIPDWMQIYYETNTIFDTGLASGSQEVEIPFGPGASTTITVVMNEGDNSNPDTAWEYTISATHPDFGFFTYTDDPVCPPVKFVLPPFDVIPAGEKRFRVRPEEPLAAFRGSLAQGAWKLEVRDAFAGPGNGIPPVLLDAELSFLMAKSYPPPIPLPEAAPTSVSLAPLQTRWFEVATHIWTEAATNCIVGSSGPVNLLFSAEIPVGGEAPGVATLLANTTSGCVTLSPGSIPPLLPGSKFYLGVQNTNQSFVQTSLQRQTSPTVRSLSNRVPMIEPGLAANDCAYYTFVVAPASQRTQFRLSNLTGDAALLVKRGLPLPDTGNAAAISDNPGSTAELLILRTSDVPLLLDSGAWFITVTNKSATTVSYEIEAGQWGETGLPIIITPSLVSGMIQLEWNSLPGVDYQVVTSTELTGAWVPEGNVVLADEDTTTVSLPASASFRFFRVMEVPPQE